MMRVLTAKVWVHQRAMPFLAFLNWLDRLSLPLFHLVGWQAFSEVVVCFLLLEVVLFCIIVVGRRGLVL